MRFGRPAGTRTLRKINVNTAPCLERGSLSLRVKLPHPSSAPVELLGEPAELGHDPAAWLDEADVDAQRIDGRESRVRYLPPVTRDLDLAVRLAAFEFLAHQVQAHGEVLPARTLNQGFSFEGQRVRLKGQQGIFKPAILPYMPLSITTAPTAPGRGRPYDDGFSDDGGILHYR